MSNIDYDRFTRVATRCAELASDPAQPPIVGLVYKETAELRLSTFLTDAATLDRWIDNVFGAKSSADVLS